MSMLFVLIPLGLMLLAIAAWAFIWAVDHDQFEDLDRAGESILYDDDIATPDAEAAAVQSAGSTARSAAVDAAASESDVQQPD